MTESSTAQLAQQQAALAAALVGNGSMPDGFDAERIAMASKMLLRKRTHAALASWPAFTQLYGADVERDFAGYAQAHPMAPGTTPRADLLSFAKYRESDGKLPEMMLRFIARAEARYWVPVRRGPFVSVRVPLLGVFTFRFRA